MVTVKAPAKINLALGVGQQRDDSFHPLATVYHAVDVYDEVRAEPAEDDSITVRVHYEGLESSVVPVGDDNLAVQAAQALRTYIGDGGGVRLSIRKVIPIAGGMAGGSADAAAALVACSEMWGTGLPRDKLEHLAGDIGSDVPFLLHGGTAMGDGRGERISPVLARGSYTWVLALQNRGLSTSGVFAEYDRHTPGGYDAGGHDAGEQGAGKHPSIPAVPDDLLTALRSGDAAQLGAALSNDLHEAALELDPDLYRVFELGDECQALGSVLCGSGPTVALLATDEQHATDIAVALAASNACADVVTATGPVPGARRTS